MYLLRFIFQLFIFISFSLFFWRILLVFFLIRIIFHDGFLFYVMNNFFIFFEVVFFWWNHKTLYSTIKALHIRPLRP